MSLLFIEGFGAYGTGTHPAGSVDDLKLNWAFWDETPTLTEESTAQGRRCYLTAAGGQNGLDLQPRFNPSGGLGTGKTTLVVGMRVYHEGTSPFITHLVRFQDGASHLGSLILTPSGHLQYTTENQQGISSTLPLSTKTVTMFAYHYIELKISFDGSTGTIDFFIDGVAAGSFTGQDTIFQGTSCDNIRFFVADAAATFRDDGIFRVTDIYIDDATVRGPMEVWYQAADSLGSAANFTPSAGSNHENVDDLDFDADASYNESTATTTLDQIAHSDLLSVAPLVIQPMVMARYVPTGSAQLKVGILSGTTHDQESAEGLSDVYEGYKGKFYENDPNTAAAWTAGNADAAETSYEHTA